MSLLQLLISLLPLLVVLFDLLQLLDHLSLPGLTLLQHFILLAQFLIVSMRLVLELGPHLPHLTLQSLVLFEQICHPLLGFRVKLGLGGRLLLRSAGFCLLSTDELVLSRKQFLILLLQGLDPCLKLLLDLECLCQLSLHQLFVLVMILHSLAVGLLDRHKGVLEVHHHVHKLIVVLISVVTPTCTVLGLAVRVDGHAVLQVVVVFVLGGLEI